MQMETMSPEIQKKTTTKIDINLAKKVDVVIRQAMFWAYAEMLLNVAVLLELLSSWSEGCASHKEEHKQDSWSKRKRQIQGSLRASMADDGVEVQSPN
jgi:hypothetical protein